MKGEGVKAISLNALALRSIMTEVSFIPAGGSDVSRAVIAVPGWRGGGGG